MSDSRDPSRPDSIDLGSPGEVEALARHLDATAQQIQDAAKAVGPRVADIELHLKGSRSTSNDDRMEQAPSPNTSSGGRA